MFKKVLRRKEQEFYWDQRKSAADLESLAVEVRKDVE